MKPMKKVISMVMAAAMVTSLVPATAFAADTTSGDVSATAQIIGAENYNANINDKEINKNTDVQLKVTSAEYSSQDKTSTKEYKFTLTLDGAEFSSKYTPVIGVKDDSAADTYEADAQDRAGKTVVDNVDLEGKYTVKFDFVDTDEVEITLTGTDAENDKLEKDDTIFVSLGNATADKGATSFTSNGKGKTAKVAVTSDDIKISNDGSDLVYASVEAKGIKASVKKVKDVAVEEIAKLDDIKIETAVGQFENLFSSKPDAKAELKLKLNSGFEFVTKDGDIQAVLNDGTNDFKLTDGDNITVDEDEIIIHDVRKVEDKDTSNKLSLTTDTWTIKDLSVEATTAKSGATATVKVYATGADTVSVEVAKAIDNAVAMTVDADADLPVIYSGVNVNNKGIVDDSDHEALEVTIKESFPGAWNDNKEFTLTLPEGVYVAEVKNPAFDYVEILNDGNDVNKFFEAAYKKGDFEKLTFAKRTWKDESDTKDKSELTFSLVLVADPNFEGDVTLKLEGDSVETQEVKIAKFVKPFVVKAEQNDLKIDYRQTKIPTNVTITEAEAGLWDRDATFAVSLDKISFDDDAKVTVDEKSGLEVKSVKTNDGVIEFTVDHRSDDTPATVTVSDMTLFMNRSLPAGAYDLEVISTTMNGAWDKDDKLEKDSGYLAQKILGAEGDGKEHDIIDDINEDFYSEVVKAGFVNIVTAGREDADSFTTKVVVPVGEKYLFSGETKVELDVAAYISASNYTMLPVRAVAKALGIPNENVIWNGEARTATVMYGSKVITMTVGQKTMYINGAPVPTSSAVEIKEENGVGRAFLPMRDLGVALGVADITWDAATKTATLNGTK